MVHDTARVAPDAILGEGVEIGPFAYVGSEVQIGAGTRVGPHAVLLGPTRIGQDNHIHAHACLGDAPQDLDYRNQPTRLEIGSGNTIREFVTMHRGTPKDNGVTRVGDGGMFMAYSHVAHDCRIGDGVILANGVNLGGHVQVGNRANLGGLSAVHQFVRIGELAMLGGGSIVVRDVPPYMVAAGNHARLYGLNRRGLQRAGIPADRLRALKRAYRLLYRSGLAFDEACALVAETRPMAPEVEQLLAFFQNTGRGVMR